MTMAPDQPGAMSTQPTRGDTRPVPDPTVLTTQQLYREIAALREIITTRLDGMQEAVVVLQTTTNRSPTPGEIHLDLSNFKELVKEKFETSNVRFESVAREFALRQDSEKQSALDRKEELKTALSAAEKAVDKSGTATGELLRQQVELLRTTKEGLDTQIGDVKVRLATAEANASSAEKSAASALASQRSDTTTHQVDRGYNSTMLFSVISALVAVGAIAIAILKP